MITFDSVSTDRELPSSQVIPRMVLGTPPFFCQNPSKKDDVILQNLQLDKNLKSEK